VSYRHAGLAAFAGLFGSLFLPWVHLAQFRTASPATVMAAIPPEARDTRLIDALQRGVAAGDPGASLAALVLLSLALAGTGTLLALAGWLPRLIGLATGAAVLAASAFGYGLLAAEAPSRFRQAPAAADALLSREALALIGSGAWTYLGCGIALILTTLFWPAPQRRPAGVTTRGA
jgi:hypothetical protein